MTHFTSALFFDDALQYSQDRLGTSIAINKVEGNKMKFKKGDKVRCIDDGYEYITKGNIYEVLDVNPVLHKIKIARDTNIDKLHSYASIEQWYTCSDFRRVMANYPKEAV